MWRREGPYQVTSRVVTDGDGNLYIGGGWDLGAWKVLSTDSLGNEKWRFYARPDDYGKIVFLALDSLGNLFACGNEGEYPVPVVYKLDTSGNLLWKKKWSDDRGQADALVPDNSGGVYVGGDLRKYSPPIPITFIVHLIDDQTIAENEAGGQKFTLAMAPSGFFISSGYDGDAQIYDPAGRLVLSKEVKGKTLISPLAPGVYFVVAGKQRGKVAVR